jgi:hypothetical protein
VHAGGRRSKVIIKLYVVDEDYQVYVYLALNCGNLSVLSNFSLFYPKFAWEVFPDDGYNIMD